MFRIFSVILLTFSIASPASAYYVSIGGQALANGDPNEDDYSEIVFDGVPALSYDTGLLSSGQTTYVGTARSFSSVNLATGALKIYAEVNGDSVAQARARFVDTVFFDLPEGVTESSVTFTLDVEGILAGNFSRGALGANSLRISPINTTQAGGLDQFNLSDLYVSGETLPQHLEVTLPVFAGIAYQVDAGLSASTNLTLSSDDFGLVDMANTAFLSIDMDEGVSFSSESGVLLTSPVPLPAAAWLFGSALLGLGAIRRRRA